MFANITDRKTFFCFKLQHSSCHVTGCDALLISQLVQLGKSQIVPG